MRKQAQSYDVVIVGGGPAGLSLAKSLADTDLTIAVIDPAPEAVLAAPSYDGRETALTHLSHKILTDLDILGHVAADDISLIKKARVINGTSPYALHFDNDEAGEETLGYMISNQNIRKASYQALKGCDNVTLLTERKVSSLETDQAGARVILSDESVIEARLVVGADGRFSNTRRTMGIETSMLDLGKTCIVAIMNHSESHNDTAYECFHYDQTLAVLPLNNGKVSIVITLPSDKADDLLSMSPEEFARDIEERFEYRVGSMSMASELFPYPLVCNYAEHFYAERYALLGDAAVGMHPVTAHGYNLGLRGANTLATEIKTMIETGGDIGSPVALKRYGRKHHLICKPLYLGTNMLVKLYSNTTKPAKFARKTLLKLGNVLTPAKRLITNQLTESKAV